MCVSELWGVDNRGVNVRYAPMTSESFREVVVFLYIPNRFKIAVSNVKGRLSLQRCRCLISPIHLI